MAQLDFGAEQSYHQFRGALFKQYYVTIVHCKLCNCAKSDLLRVHAAHFDSLADLVAWEDGRHAAAIRACVPCVHARLGACYRYRLAVYCVKLRVLELATVYLRAAPN